MGGQGPCAGGRRRCMTPCSQGPLTGGVSQGGEHAGRWIGRPELCARDHGYASPCVRPLPRREASTRRRAPHRARLCVAILDRPPGRSRIATSARPGPRKGVPAGEPDGRALGRCCGGRTTKTVKRRNTVERCINRLKLWRGIATRYEKIATMHRQDSPSRPPSPGPPADSNETASSPPGRSAGLRHHPHYRLAPAGHRFAWNMSTHP